MKDGLIEIGSEKANELGFSRKLFEGYLWKIGDIIYISFIVSRRQNEGNLSMLFAKIEERGFRVAVPTPLGKMQSILQKKGFLPTHEGEHEVWMKK